MTTLQRLAGEAKECLRRREERRVYGLSDAALAERIGRLQRELDALTMDLLADPIEGERAIEGRIIRKARELGQALWAMEWRESREVE